MKNPLHFFRIMRNIFFVLLTFSSAVTANASSYPEITFILDASGSMLGKAGDKIKIEAAKAVMSQIIPGLAPEVKVGLVAYGHRRKGDCKDIEVLIKTGSDDRIALLDKVMALQPKGKTPITGAVTTVVEQLKTKENETTIVLISDGLETCAADPCKAVKDLKETGIKFIMHVVGFGVSEEENQQLGCLAKAGGGKYLVANDTQSLLDALNSVSKEIAKKVAVEKAKSVQVKAETGLGKIKLIMPESTTKGMSGLKIIRLSDGKTVKEAGKLSAETIHPMIAGEYEVEYLFASPNYGAPTISKLGRISLSSQTIADAAEDEGAPLSAQPLLQARPPSGNKSTLWTPYIIPEGKYRLMVQVKGMDEPLPVAEELLIQKGQMLNFDSGL